MTTSERIIWEALTLPAADRLEVIEQLWESLAAAPESLDFPDSQRKRLDQRIKEMDANPEAGMSWEDVKAERRSPR